MTPELREQLRLSVLRLVEAAGHVGLRASSLRIHLAAAGFEQLPTGELGNEVAYLHDKGLLAPVEKEISPEVARLRITASGRDFLAKEGLA